MFAQEDYTKRYGGVARAVRWRLSGKTWLGIALKTLLVFRIQTGHDIEHNTPDRLFMLDKK